MLWVTIRSYEHGYQAELAKLRLESCGIGSRLVGEQASSILPHMSNAMGGVKLEVKAEDAELAVELLDASEIEPAAQLGAYRKPGRKPAKKKRKKMVEEGPLPEEMRAEALELPGDPIASRAYNASLLGVFMCPGLAHLYALWLLADIKSRSLQLTDRGERFARRARTISYVMVGVAAAGAVLGLLQ